MTEKRFTLVDIGFVYDNDTLIGMKEIVELLNMLHEENQQFRTALKELKEIGDYQAHRIEELTNENIKLEDQLKNLRKLANELYMEGSEWVVV